MSFAVERNVRQARRILEVRADAVEAAAQVSWQASLDLAIAQVDLHPERGVEAVPQRLLAGLRTCGERRHLCLDQVCQERACATARPYPLRPRQNTNAASGASTACIVAIEYRSFISSLNT